MLPPHLAAEAAADLGGSIGRQRTTTTRTASRSAFRAAASTSCYGDAFPHEADMDQLGGVDFDKGCYVGQEVVSRVEHRATARSRVVPIAYDEFAPEDGLPVMAGEKQVGTLGSAANRRGIAMLRLDRVADAIAAGIPLAGRRRCDPRGQAGLGQIPRSPANRAAQ